MKNSKVICRPCKEQNNWEIQGPDGKVLDKHFATRFECVKEGERLAMECGCELCVLDHYE